MVTEGWKSLHNISLKNNKGMATVEATLVLSLFYIVIFLFLQMGIICNVQLKVYEAFSSAMEEVAERTYIYEGIDSQSMTNASVYSDVLISFRTKLKEIPLLEKYVMGKTGGILLTKVVCNEEGYLIGNICYYISVSLPLFQLSPICVKEQIIEKAYVGYQSSGNNDEYVYITDYKSVYHLSRGCSHIALTIYKIDKSEAYHLPACDYCGHVGEPLYATKAGDCYHTTLACQGLKRTVKRVKKSTVVGLPPCEICGG